MQDPGDLSGIQLIRDLKTLRRKVNELEVVNAALRRSVESLLSRESRFSIAMAAARAGIWELDLERGRVVLDPSLGQILGLDADETGFELTRILDIIPDSEKARLSRERLRLVNGETDFIQLEFRVESGSDGTRWLAIYGSLALDGDGQPARMVGVCRDVTAFREGHGREESEDPGARQRTQDAQHRQNQQ
jgi:PAS domain S-box-containing protein